MKSNLIYLKQVKASPPELIRETLTSELFEKLKMESVPVMILDGKENWGGYCQDKDYTEHGEIVVSSVRIAETVTRSNELRMEELTDIYLHECAHRLMECGHNANFLCMNLVLRLRLDNKSILDRVKLYDIKDEGYSPEAYKFAWDLANELAFTDMDCNQIAIEIQKRVDDYRNEKDQAKVKKESYLRKLETDVVEIEHENSSLHRKVYDLRIEIKLSRYAGFAIGCVAATFLNVIYNIAFA